MIDAAEAGAPFDASPRRSGSPWSGALALPLSLWLAGASPPAAALPVERVKACEALGDGFLSIPNTDTCFRLTGYVRAQAFLHEGGVADDYFDGDPFVIVGRRTENATFSTLSRGQATLDARTRTDYGTLRSSVRLRGIDGVYDGEDGVKMTRAFVQVRGFTAGLIPSFFALENPVAYFGTHVTDFTEEQVLFGYTADLARDLTASLALESGELSASSDSLRLRRALGRDFSADGRGQEPAAIGNIRYEPSWGTMQVSGAVQRTRPRLSAEGGSVERFRERTGFAAAAGVSAKLPWLGERDEAVLNVSASRGLSFYTIGTGGNVVFTSLDELSDVTVFALFSGLVHWWNPELRSNIGFGFSDTRFNLPAGADRARGLTATGNLVWSPVRNLDLGIELVYAHIDAERNAAAILDTARRPEGAFSAVLRVERAFGP